MSMKKEALVFISNGFADWEAAYVCAILNSPESEYAVRTIGLDRAPKTSMGGMHTVPDLSVSDEPRDFSILILIGGTSWKEHINNDVLPLVEYAVSNHILVGAICDATCFMADNGYLDGIKHTGNTLEHMVSQAPNYKGACNFIERQAVYDSGIITANGTAALEFTRDIAMLLKAIPEERIFEWYYINKMGLYKD